MIIYMLAINTHISKSKYFDMFDSFIIIYLYLCDFSHQIEKKVLNIIYVLTPFKLIDLF